MKGVLKGLRYISQIFDDDKEQEMQIGFPTDVKHVAHLGRDGPSVDSPSWMREFNTPQDQFQSEPLQANGEPPLENPDIKCHSRDSSRKNSSSSRRSQNSGESSEQKKSSRRRSLPDGSLASGSPRRDPSAKSRQSSSRTKPPSPDRSKPTRYSKDSDIGPESSPKRLPDIPKKSHRRKSKQVGSGGSTRPTRSKADPPSPAYKSPFSDPGPGPQRGSNYGPLAHASGSRPPVEEGECNGLSKVS